MVAISYCLLVMSYRLVNINYTLVSRLLKLHIPSGGKIYLRASPTSADLLTNVASQHYFKSRPLSQLTLY